MCFTPKFAHFEYEISQTKSQDRPRLNKKISFIKDMKDKYLLHPEIIVIPCGKCLACRIDQANNWATRCYLESKKWKNNFFITLTIDEKNNTKSLEKREIQLFFKRLRKNHSKFRYFLCGEYGSKTFRPHYHMGAFGLEPFEDMKLWKKSKTGYPIYVSDKLNKIWGKGYCYIEYMAYETSAYIARYTQKKINRNYDRICDNLKIEREFKLTSRKPGIALDITDKQTEWEKIKNNFGILVKYKDKIRLKGIPQALRKKWRDIDRYEYFEESDKNTKRTKEEFKKQLEKTSLTPKEYIIQQAKETEIRLKKLKRNAI